MKVEAVKFYLISTEIGTMAVRREIVSDFDVDALIRNRAVSQGRALQMVNVGKQIDGNSSLPAGSLPSIFRDADEELPERAL